jgi:hypothetical protein
MNVATGATLRLTCPGRRVPMGVMSRTLRTLAAVLAGLALVAALPAPCGCAAERSASRHADEHACCAPPAGVSAAGRTCCDESPAIADAAPSPAGPATAPVVVASLRVEAPSALLVLARLAVTPAFSPPLTALRI